MNLKSLNKYGIPMFGDFVDQNAYYDLRVPAPPPRGPANPIVTVGPNHSAPATTATGTSNNSNYRYTFAGVLYAFYFSLNFTVDQYNNVGVNYDGQSKGLVQVQAPSSTYPPQPSTTNIAWIYASINIGDNQWGDVNPLIVSIQYSIDGGTTFSTTPPVGNSSTATNVVARAVVTLPFSYTFPSVYYTILPQLQQQTTLSFQNQPSTFEYDGTGYDYSQYISTNSDAPIVVSYSGTGSTSYGPSTTFPVNAGNYVVTASQQANTNFTAATAYANFAISQIQNVTAFTPNTSQAYYTGSPIPLTFTTIPSNLNYTVKYNGSSNDPTNIGVYNVQAQISDPNVNPNAGGAIASSVFTITKSNQVPATAANATTIIRATYNAATSKFLVDFVGTYA